MSVRVLLEFAKPTMRLARPIFDGDGKLIAGSGTLLSERMVQLLRRLALQTVVVEDADDLNEWETVTAVEADLAGLEQRFRRESPAPPLRAIYEAISRRLVKRAEALAEDPALTAQPDSGSPGLPVSNPGPANPAPGSGETGAT
jgi:hypothetical protein